jgi:hypothetical protein
MSYSKSTTSVIKLSTYLYFKFVYLSGIPYASLIRMTSVANCSGYSTPPGHTVRTSDPTGKSKVYLIFLLVGYFTPLVISRPIVP